MIQIKRRFALVSLALATSCVAVAADLESDSSADAFSPPQGGGGASGGHKVAIGLKVSVLLGPGIEGAVEVTRKSNIRGGFNYFNYGLNETKDGVSYNAQLHLRAVDALYDWFPFGGGFHLSGGALLYNGNAIKATASVPGGRGFTLGGVSYTSEPSNPIVGTGELDLGNKAAPMGLLGWTRLPAAAVM
jgi:hypothetical protein